MSTRANVIIESKKYDERIILYRHSDGYPEGTLPTLEIFMDWMKSDKIRNDVSQGGSWLIILGAMELDTILEFGTSEGYGIKDTFRPPKDWKSGSYEITTCIHNDIEYLYTIDMDTRELTYRQVEYGEAAKQWKEGTL